MPEIHTRGCETEPLEYGSLGVLGLANVWSSAHKAMDQVTSCPQPSGRRPAGKRNNSGEPGARLPFSFKIEITFNFS